MLTVADQFRSQTVTLAGIGIAPPGVSLAPANGLSFAATGVGLTAAAQTVTLTNNGGVTLTLARITATGDYAIVTGSSTCGTTLAPAAACSLQVSFVPTVAGPRVGSLTFIDNAGNSPQSLPLTGVGVDFTMSVKRSFHADAGQWRECNLLPSAELRRRTPRQTSS